MGKLARVECTSSPPIEEGLVGEVGACWVYFLTTYREEGLVGKSARVECTSSPPI